MKDLFRNAVILLTLMAIGAFGAWIYLRPEIPRGSTLTDGEAAVSSRRLREELRLALWQEPEVFSRDLSSDLTETDPFLDAASGRFYFALGEPGLDQDLWVATRAAGGGFDFDQLDEVNTTFNESAPAFHDGALYFASNRPGGKGGLDLWRSRRTDRGFLPPENLGGAINTDADETDPEFRPGSRDLYFASNRDATVGIADHDLFVSVTDGDRFSDAAAVPHATPYDERSPTFAADGRLLVFASDRPGGSGGSDLYRMLQRDGAWDAPELLQGVNTPADEWAPSLADGGFTLYFSSDRDADAGHPEHDVFVSRTRELFAVPGGGFSLLDLTILFLLALVALLAYLARRWSALDIIYKCLLASILLHLLLLWLSRRVDIEVEEVPLPSGSDTYEVQLLTNLLDAAQRMEDRAHGENISAPAPTTTTQIARARPTPEAVTTPRAESAEMLRATSVAAEAPAATPSQVSPLLANAPAPTTPVQTFEEAYERIQGSAPQMTVSGAEVATPAAQAQPQLVRSAEAATPSSTPQSAPATGASLARAEFQANAPAATHTTHAPTAAAASAEPSPNRTEMPSDRVERTTHEGRPELTVAATETASAAPRGDLARPERTAVSSSAAAPLPAQPSSEVMLVRADGSRHMNSATPSRATPAASPGLAAADPGAIRTEAPTDRVEAATTTAAAASEPTMELGPTAAGRLVARADSTATPASPASLPSPGPASATLAPSSTSALARARRSDATPVRPAMPSLTARSLSSADAGGVPVAEPDDRAVMIGPALPTDFGVAQGELAPATFAAPQPTSGELQPTRLPTRLTAGGPAARPRESATTLERGSLDLPQGPERPTATAERTLEEVARPSPVQFAEAERADATASRSTRGPDSAPSLNSVAGTPRSFGRPGGATRPGAPSRAQFVLADPGSHAPIAAPLTMPDLAPAAEATAPERQPALYERRSGAGKKTALERGGGSQETERAVNSGLRYLARVQRRNGSFGDANDGTERQKYRDVRMGKTGLAALAFLGAGHTPASETEFSENVGRAIAWMLSQQDPGSGHFGNNAGYGHGIATYALAECYAMTRDRSYLPYLMRAVRHILDYQVLSARDRKLIGGWRYYYPEGQNGPDPYPRTSLSSWQVMALESAMAGGVPVPEESLVAAQSYFRNCYDRQYGYYRYNHNPEWLENTGGYRTLPASTPASLFVLSLLGEPNNANMDTAATYVMDRLPSGYRYRGNDAFARDATGNLYFWYYGSLAMFLRGGQDWRRWNDAMKATLLPAQNPDGSWTEMSAYSTQYAGDDPRERSYTTAISVLTLEVYYRYFTPQLMRQGR